jgi:uncharacterized protein
MSRFYLTSRLVCLGIVLWGLAGCIGVSPPARFYLLGSLAQGEAPPMVVAKESPAVLVGPVTLAAYLDRDQLVARSGPVELRVAPFDRWAEPLSDGIYRVLQENLSVLLATPHVSTVLQQSPGPADFQIAVHVSRFDQGADGGAHLTAFWSLENIRAGGAALRKKTVVHVAAASPALGDRVQAQDQALTVFSREIAAAIADAAKPPP